MNKRNRLMCAGLAAVALYWAAGQARAQTTPTIGPVPGTNINYTIANYANSPLPTLSGSLTGVRLTDPGCGYSGAPTIVIDPPLDASGALIVGGIQATATVSLGTSGDLTNVVVVTPGSGYITVPTVAIYNTNSAGAPVTCNCGATAVAQMGVLPGTGLRKFIDSLPGLNTANDLGQSIPVAVSDKTTYPGSDYYEIALVEYTEKMHFDLPGPSRLRGYVQLGTATVPGTIALPGTTLKAVTAPSYLGPVISATKNVPTRIKFYNLLPTGASGNLFLPVDTTIMGAGPFDVNWNPTNGTPLGNNTPNITGNFLQNRATLHLHGGLTPWISDGTPHQWTIPVGETSAFPKGSSTANVPDMPIPSQGTMTFYYPNQQSGRLMFYHDHAYGLTRLNVYAGEAAGYLLTDPAEEGSLVAAGVPATGIPLVIQDKTFVWGTNATGTGTYATDPSWATLFPSSQPGDLWLPHVYMPNQNPADAFTGANPLGRWDYGPWFWPPQTLNVLPMPVVSTTPEMFMDTPLVNGTAYPYADVPAGLVRFRVLNACNDRMLNLQLYQADTNGYTVTNATTGATFGTEVTMVAAVANPAIPFPTAWLAQVPGMIPEILDNRPGGVPDPRLRGPAIVQIGTEGGILPAPVVLPNTPVGYEQNKRNIVVLNVSKRTLFLGPAERADVLIDFTAYAGKTVILYNDSPAPVPAGDPRIDYYTGNGDYSVTGGANNQGGAPSTLPGYGPNTRTIMQFRVAGTPAATPPVGDEVPTNLATISNAVAVAFVNRNEAPIVPEPSYPAGTPGYSPTATYSRIQDTSVSFVPAGGSPVTAITVVTPGTNYSGPGGTTTITIALPTGPGGGQATVTGWTTNGSGGITSITAFTGGSGYLVPPIVTISDLSNPLAGGAVLTASIGSMGIPMQPKALHELFDTYGRMNSVLGIELPFTSFLIQTTIPYQYIDPATETIPAGMTQVWKITHNGVDTHAIHFHLVNVQVINRVGWDGAIRPPDANELGWKETVRMNPLEDVIVAATARVPVLPFAVPTSSRPLDVTQPLGTTAQFTGINPANGTPLTVANAFTSFGWEYVWHCHLLGHEENDMMRPLVMTGATAGGATGYQKNPTITATLPPPTTTLNGGWYSAAGVVVTLTATPWLGGPAIQSITYSATGAQTIPSTTTAANPTTTPIINVSGVTTVSYSTLDAMGFYSVPLPKTVAVNVDGTLPTLTETVSRAIVAFATSGTTNITVTGTVQDIPLQSGVNRATGTYSVTSPAGTGYTAYSASGTFNISANPGNYSFTVTLPRNVRRVFTITVRANDNVGNIGTFVPARTVTIQ